MWKRLAILLSILNLGMAATARAADLNELQSPPASSLPFFVDIGVGGLFIDSGAKIKMGGVVVPGATVNIPPQVTAVFDLGYYLTPNIAIAFAGGVPPTATVNGAGAAQGFGKLGSILYAPMATLAQYHFTNWGPIQPYVGAGPLIMVVLNDSDAAMTNMDVSPAIGAVVQIGADFMFNSRMGVYVDVKKSYLRTTATGFVAGAPVSAQVRLDPIVVSGGLTYRF